jgi:predicted nuclease with TOPRIM domain
VQRFQGHSPKWNPFTFVGEFAARFERLTGEKMNVLRRAANVEAELDKAKADVARLEAEVQRTKLDGERHEKAAASLEQRLTEATKENVSLNEKVRLTFS